MSSDPIAAAMSQFVDQLARDIREARARVLRQADRWEADRADAEEDDGLTPRMQAVLDRYWAEIAAAVDAGRVAAFSPLERLNVLSFVRWLDRQDDASQTSRADTAVAEMRHATRLLTAQGTRFESYHARLAGALGLDAETSWDTLLETVAARLGCPRSD